MHPLGRCGTCGAGIRLDLSVLREILTDFLEDEHGGTAVLSQDGCRPVDLRRPHNGSVFSGTLNGHGGHCHRGCGCDRDEV
jgi:hypothetical protein